MASIEVTSAERSDIFCTRDADADLMVALIGGDSTKLRQWCRLNPDKLRLALDWIHPQHQVQRGIVELALLDCQKGREEERHRKVIERLEAIEKPHWTMTPGFYATIAGVLLAGLAAWFAWLSIPRPTPRDAGAPVNASSTQPPAEPQLEPKKQ